MPAAKSWYVIFQAWKSRRYGAYMYCTTATFGTHTHTHISCLELNLKWFSFLSTANQITQLNAGSERNGEINFTSSLKMYIFEKYIQRNMPLTLDNLQSFCSVNRALCYRNSANGTYSTHLCLNAETKCLKRFHSICISSRRKWFLARTEFGRCKV